MSMHMHIIKMRLCHMDDNATDYPTKTSVPGMRTFFSGYWSRKTKSLPKNVGDYCCHLLSPNIGRTFLLLKEPGRTELDLIQMSPP